MINCTARKARFSFLLLASLFLCALSARPGFSLSGSNELRSRGLAQKSRKGVLLVVNQEDANLSIIDPATNQKIATISEGQSGKLHAHEVAISRNGHTAYLPIYGDSGVGKPGIDGREMLVADIPSRKIIDRVDFGHGVRPHCSMTLRARCCM